MFFHPNNLYNVLKKQYRLITLKIFITVLINGIVFSGGLFSQLDILLQRFTQYNHQQKNHERSLQEETVPTGLKLKKSAGLASWARF